MTTNGNGHHGNGNGNGHANGNGAGHGAKVRLGLIGAGRIAQAYIDVVQQSDVADLVAVADVDEAAAIALAGHFGARPFSSHEALSEAMDLDGVVICTPPVTHGEIARHFLEREVPVLCEKPLAVDLATACELIEVAEANDVILTMAAKFRFVDDVTRAKHILDSGILGEIIVFENAFTSRVDMAGRWNADPAVSGGGVLIDNGTHSIDIVRFFLGPVGEVMAMEGKRAQNLEVEETTQVFLRSTEGVIGTIDLSWSLDKSLDHYIQIYGSEGEIRIGWRGSSYRQVSSPDWVSFGTGYDKVAAMGGAVDNFCRAVMGVEPLLITSEDALASVAVVEKAYASMRANHWVPVPAPLVGAADPAG